MVERIPSWLGRSVDRAGVERIEAAVRAGELKTAGEIVPVVVRRSTRLGVLPFFTASLSLLLFLGLKLEGLLPWELHLWTLIPFSLGFLTLGYALGLSSLVQRFLLPAQEQKDSVEQRALLEFYGSQLDKTDGRTGILLFVSLMEHRAVVLADKGIAQHCQPQVFDEVVADLISGAKSGDLSAGYVKAIARCSDILAPHFPPSSADKNELKDYLRIKE